MSAGLARRLGLGTVQFGLDYGVTNTGGRVPKPVVANILDVAARAGMDTVDTAALYGESEAALGSFGAADRFRIITKTPKFADAADPQAAVARLGQALDASLAKLRAPCLDALLVHDADDLTGPHGPALWSAMETARGVGRVGRIGVSVYDGAQLDAVVGRFPIDIVQLPWNPLDRRIEASGRLDRLAATGVEVHARSLFLQGLLLQDPTAIPAKFGPLRDAVAELHAWAREHGLTPLEGVLASAASMPQIDRFIVGAPSVEELQQIVLAAEIAQGVHLTTVFASSVALDVCHLNPSRWAELDERPLRERMKEAK